MTYFLLIPVSVFLFYQFSRLRSLAKHDKILFPICQIRRDIMSFFMKNGVEISEVNYREALDLLKAVDITIHYYNPLKTNFFNLRRFQEHVTKTREGKKIINKLSKNEEIRDLQGRFGNAIIKGFLAYTPFVRSEFCLKTILFLITRIANKNIEEIDRSVEQARQLRKEYLISNKVAC